MKHFSRVFAASSLLFISTSGFHHLSAQVTDDPKLEFKAVDLTKFMRKGQTTLDAGQRRAVYLHQVSALYRTADLNHDGVISNQEIAKLEVKASDDSGYYVDKDKEMFGTKTTTPKELYVSHIASKPDPTFTPNPLNIQVRRTMEDISGPFDAKQADKFKAAKAAEFGFTSNNVSGNDAYSARGVMARSFNMPGGYWMPSIQFDRVGNSKDTTKDINSLIFGATAVWVPQASGPIDYHEIRLGARSATNFDFEPGLSGGELQYLPIFDFWSNGSFDPIPGVPNWFVRTKQWLHTEAGVDDRENAVEDSYFRSGGAVGVELIPGLDRLLVSAEYRYYFDLLGHNDGDYDNFKASISWKLDPLGNFVLQASYENGLVPLNMQDVDLFSFGLGVKY